MKRFIAVVERKPGVTAAEIANYSAKETERFKELFDAGLIWQYYKQLDAGNYWLIVHSSSLEEAQAQLYTFPYYGLGFITIRIVELDENKLTR